MRKRVFLLAALIIGFSGMASAEVDKSGRGGALSVSGAAKQERSIASASLVCAKGGAIAASVEDGACTIYAAKGSRAAGAEAIVCRNKANGDYAWINCTSGCVGARGSGRCGVSGF